MHNTDMRRSGAPVRRHSREKGNCERAFWRSFDPRDTGRVMLAAERYERSRRAPGQRNGPLGPIGLEVLRELLRLVDFKSGRLEPAIATLAQRLRRSRDAIVRALANLRRAGFVDWLRRWEPGADETQPVKQASNAYRLSLPAAAARLIGIRWHGAPDDDDARRQDHAAAQLAMFRTLTESEKAETLGDTPLGRAMVRLARRALFEKSMPDGQKPARDSLLRDE